MAEQGPRGDQRRPDPRKGRRWAGRRRGAQRGPGAIPKRAPERRPPCGAEHGAAGGVPPEGQRPERGRAPVRSPARLSGSVSKGRRARRPVVDGTCAAGRGPFGLVGMGRRKKNGAPEGAPTRFLAPGSKRQDPRRGAAGGRKDGPKRGRAAGHTTAAGGGPQAAGEKGLARSKHEEHPQNRLPGREAATGAPPWQQASGKGPRPPPREGADSRKPLRRLL